jgi:hypothetical protein
MLWRLWVGVDGGAGCPQVNIGPSSSHGGASLVLRRVKGFAARGIASGSSRWRRLSPREGGGNESEEQPAVGALFWISSSGVAEQGRAQDEVAAGTQEGQGFGFIGRKLKSCGRKGHGGAASGHRWPKWSSCFL